MALITVDFRTPSRLVALDLAHRFRLRGWTVAVGRPAHSDEGRVVQVTAPTSAVEDLRKVASATAPGIVELPRA